MTLGQILITAYAITFLMGFFAVRTENTIKEANVEWAEVLIIFTPGFNIIYAISVFIGYMEYKDRHSERPPFLNRLFMVKHNKEEGS